MDRSLLRRPGFQGLSSELSLRRGTTDFGPTPGAAEEGPRRSRIIRLWDLAESTAAGWSGR
jgi:hypothetical protein